MEKLIYSRDMFGEEITRYFPDEGAARAFQVEQMKRHGHICVWRWETVGKEDENGGKTRATV